MAKLLCFNIFTLYWISLTSFYGLISFAASDFENMLRFLKTFQRHACDGEQLKIDCPNETLISVHLVRYGRPYGLHDVCKKRRHSRNSPANSETENNTDCVSEAAFEVIHRTCQNKRSCRLWTSPVTFKDDPCPEIQKYAEVAYKCKPEGFVQKVACDGETMSLTCGSDLQIIVFSASYGHVGFGDDRCREFQQSKLANITCESKYAFISVTNLCFGKQTCSFTVNATTLGDPYCPSFHQKYLKIAFKCVPPNILRMPADLDYMPWDVDLPLLSDTQGSPIPGFNAEVQKDSTSAENDREVVRLLVGWLSAGKFMSHNRDKLILYLSLSLGVGAIFFGLVVFIHEYLFRNFHTKEDKLGVPPITDDFFTESDLEHYEGDDLITTPKHVIETTFITPNNNTISRKISESVPRAPVSDDPETNYCFS